jgi:fructokinase
MESSVASDGAGRLLGMVEAGGTKVVCAVATGPDDVRARVRLETTMPDEVFEAVKAFFDGAVPEGESLAGLGVATFGPVDVRDEFSTDYGRIMKTPKAGWAGASWVDAFRDVIRGPIVVDTDVNGAALGEAKWGAAKGLGSVVYVTVGTGIGGGVLVHGEPVHGLLHPEIGHMRVPRDATVDPFPGVCPFHGDCLEGLA